MARIGIDCRFSSLSVGLGTYTRSIVTQLVKICGDDIVLFVRSADEPWLDTLPSHIEIVIANYAHYSGAEQILFPKRIKESCIDLLYAPHFNVPLLCPVPFVVTIHDLILHRFPNHACAIKRLAYRIVMKRSVELAEHVIAVSAFTASELVAVYGSFVQRKLSVVTEGITTSQPVAHQEDLAPGYFLYVGACKQHKNVQMLIDAHHASRVDTPLVIVSNGKEVRRLKPSHGVHILRDIHDGELSTLYKQAGCFVTASAYEGFCLPILEARSHGCPIIAMNATAIPEVAGEHAFLVDNSIDSLVNALQNPPTVCDPPQPQYNWKASAEEIYVILCDAVDG